ncbi:MAG: holo-ACP synthase [Chlorobiaceae bacterium]|nr:holo-ACP synthase [Chlorobiaceae bacterium]NTV60402.1 holo-ACP synthase [Chlorobiaceae bacterium]
MSEIGMDIVNVDRIRRSFQRYGDGFLEKILTRDEIALCRNKADMLQSVASRFAAKEAISKAFGCGICGDFTWHSVEILNEPGGKPYVKKTEKMRCHPEASIKISLSHDRQYAAAVALVEFEEKSCVP